MFYSLLLASEGRTQEIAVKVTHARIEWGKKDMLKEMDHRNENISIIVNKYGEASIDLIKNPRKEVLALLERHALEIARDREDASGADAKAPKRPN
ncbi:MAG: hypothetical protein JNG83_05035 [Opitutaceae bacterium]|nr:hypothetical protein [Opitutaceae bacterium]